MSQYRTCLWCGATFRAQRRDKKYCSARCRVAYNRAANVEGEVSPPDLSRLEDLERKSPKAAGKVQQIASTYGRQAAALALDAIDAFRRKE